jgi:pimeloyl-ACP methyl ester carboxylesterase
MSADTLTTTSRVVGGTAKLEINEIGAGRPIVFLHPGIGLRGAEPFLHKLGTLGRVIAPAHPGFSSLENSRFASVDDVSYLYLSLLEELREPAIVVGSSLGGWIALEVATKSTANIAGLVLVDSVGVRFNTREVRDFADIYALSTAELDKRLYYNPAIAQIDYVNTPASELEIIARNREAETRFSWSPYLHNPRLGGRLHRVNVPTLVVWGESDGFAPLAYGQQLAGALPVASFETIANAGHFPHIEQPDQLVKHIGGFAARLHDKVAVSRTMELAR